MISINIDKAREIHKDKLRAARQPRLEALDVAYQRETEKGPEADLAPIVAEKQQLRDVTKDPAISAAATAEDLKAAWPAELLGDSPYTPPATEASNA